MRTYLPFNAFHLVQISPWPIVAGWGALVVAVGLVSWFHLSTLWGVYLGGVILGLCSFLWWRDVVREALLGHHTLKVQQGLELGFILFIASEVMFFFAFFWAFFHSSLSPSPAIGCCWPPYGITPLNPFSTPLLNTAVLLASGVSVTWGHHALMAGDKDEMLQGLGVTVMLGFYFTWLQLGEYKMTPFGINDSVYGSIFFVSTGFHGVHVMVGTVFLTVCWVRGRLEHFTSTRHLGLSMAIWYWHFVDVVWICLYLSIYWWGSGR